MAIELQMALRNAVVGLERARPCDSLEAADIERGVGRHKAADTPGFTDERGVRDLSQLRSNQSTERPRIGEA
jgi:hypothetical protein